jgi:peptidoglycan/LPS O-acetylase OafA/YrhL
MGRIKELDGLRAIAILSVLVAHFTPSNAGFSNILYLGWTGVDLFFALSGFLITSVLIGLRGHDTPFKTFYWRRTLRIFPPYYLVLALVLLFAYFHEEHVSSGAAIRCWLFLASVRLGSVKLALSRLFFGGHGMTVAPYLAPHFYILDLKDSLGIYWSLSVEEIFYLVWAPLILKASRRRILLVSAAPLLLCPVLRGLAHTPQYDEMVGFVFRLDSLVAGGWVAFAIHCVKRGYLKQRHADYAFLFASMVSGLGLLFLGRYVGVFRGVDPRRTLSFSVFGYSLIAILCSSVVGVCARWGGDLGIVSRVLRSQPAVYLGTISYTIYLSHLPVYILVQFVIIESFGQYALETSQGLVLLWGLLAITCTIFLAALSWKYFETPLLQLKEKRFPVKAAKRSTLPVPQTAIM